jgi:hypothetical protein
MAVYISYGDPQSNYGANVENLKKTEMHQKERFFMS